MSVRLSSAARLLPLLAALSLSPAWAQQISLKSDRHPSGTTFGIGLTVPEAETPPPYDVQVIRPGAQRPAWSSRQRMSGFLEMTMPVDIGNYLVLLRDERGAVVDQHPVRLFVPPQPGALKVATETAGTGEWVSVSAGLNPEFYQDRPWVGLFRLGRNAPGGASIGDALLTEARLDENGQAALRMPRAPDNYEVRLFDRFGGPFAIDRAPLQVAFQPDPQALSLDREAYEIGTPITITVTLPEGRYDRPLLELRSPQRVLRGGAVLDPVQYAYDWVDAGETTFTFQAPYYDGAYELRLLDGGGEARTIASLPVTVTASLQPGAIALQGESFVAGSEIPVQVTLAADRYYDTPRIQIVTVPGAATADRAAYTASQIEEQTVSTEGPNRFTAPRWPGTYRLELYNWRGGYLLDSRDFTVTVPPIPGALAPVKPAYEVGEPIGVRVFLEPGRFYDQPRVSLQREYVPAEGGAHLADAQLGEWIVAPDGVTELAAQAFAGLYRMRLWDARGGYMLDETVIEVVSSAFPAALASDRDTYGIGEPIHITAAIPAPHWTDWPEVRLYPAEPVSAGGTGWAEAMLSRQVIDRENGTATIEAPMLTGLYELRLLDRGGQGHVIARKEIAVEAPARNMIRIRPARPAPGEAMQVEVRFPQNVRLLGPRLMIYRSSYVTEEGVLASERPVMQRWVYEPGVIDFTAPNEPGVYEIRLSDRGDEFYALDIESFEVVSAARPDRDGQPMRLTPLPGAGAGPKLQPRPQAPEGGAPGGGEGVGADEGEGLPLPGPRPGAEPGTGPGTGPGGEAGAQPAGDGAAPGGGGGTGGGDGAAQEAAVTGVRVLQAGEGGLTPASELPPGSAFVVEAELSPGTPPGTLSATLSFGETSVSVPLAEAGGGKWRSDVLRVPSVGGN